MGIYLDNAATTAMLPEVVEAMRPFYSGDFYNPSAGYVASKKVRVKIEEARERLAALINAEPEEIYYTSGGTESDNWACNEGIRKRGHIITSTIEHKAILEPLKAYENKGGQISYVGVDSEGLIEPEHVRNLIRRNTVLITIMMANNEIGVIEPIGEIGNMAREYDVIFHSDAVQAFGHIPIDVSKLPVDMLSASAHKFNGPKGCGFIYIRKNTDIAPYIKGGGQERGMRSGTENVPGIIGMTVAAELSHKRMTKEREWNIRIRDYMLNRIRREIENVRLNGPKDKRLSNNISLSFKDVNANALLALLDIAGIYASAGSACNSKSGVSHVLQNIGVPKDYIYGTIRLTIGSFFTKKQADYVVDIIKQSVKVLRNIG